MILTRSHSSGSLRLIPDTDSSQTPNISNPNGWVGLEQGAFSPVSNSCVPPPLQPDYFNSALLSSLQKRNPAISDTVNAVSTNATQPFYVTYPALSNGKTIIPLVKNISPSAIYLPPVPKNTKPVLSGTLQTNKVVINNGQFTTLGNTTVLGNCRNSKVNHAVAIDVKMSNKSDAGFLLVAESVLSEAKVSVVNKVVRNLEMNNKSDEGFCHTTESVLSDSKALRDDKVVISNEEVNKSDKSFLPPTESVLRDSKALRDDKVVISNEEMIKSDKSFLPSTESVLLDSKALRDNKVVISNEETKNESCTTWFPTIESVSSGSGHFYVKEIGTSDGILNTKPPTSLGNSIVTNSPTTLKNTENLKISPSLGCNPNNSTISSSSTADKLIVVNVRPRKEKIIYPRECDKCLKWYKSKVTYCQHKKTCGRIKRVVVDQDVYVRKKVRAIKPLTFEEACRHWTVKVPQKQTPVPWKDKKWVHFSSGKAAYYVKSASLKK